MKKLLILGGGALTLFVIALTFINYYLYKDLFYQMKPGIKVEKIVVNSDKDKDGISDADDILEGARKEIKNHTTYKSAYYKFTSWFNVTYVSNDKKITSTNISLPAFIQFQINLSFIG